MKKELVEQAEMEQAYAVIGNLLDKSEDAEDLVAAVPVLAAKLSNDGGISWSQTMEICRFGFHHAAMLSGCMRSAIRLSPEEQARIEAEAMDVMAHGSSRKVFEELVTILMFGSRALAEETGLSQGAVMALQLQMLIAAPVPTADVDLSDVA